MTLVIGDAKIVILYVTSVLTRHLPARPVLVLISFMQPLVPQHVLLGNMEILYLGCVKIALPPAILVRTKLLRAQDVAIQNF